MRAFCIAMGFVAVATCVRPVHAATITLDFETPATGMSIAIAPLVTSAGTITATASGGIVDVMGYGGAITHLLRHNQSLDDSDYGQLAFDFDVASISFLYAGLTDGAFTAEALDASLTVVDSFVDSDTADNNPFGGPVTLSGAGIRYLRFGDYPSSGFTLVGVDNVVISTPEPGILLLLASALGLAGVCRLKPRK